MNEDIKIEGNCMTCCKHYKTESVVERKDITDDNGNVIAVTNGFVGYKHYCDIDSCWYAKWWAENGNKTSKEAYNVPCYEPEEHYKTLHKMTVLAQEIIDNIDSKNKEK